MTKIFSRDELGELFASFYGMDGGNLKAPLWVCGIEHGSTAEHLCEAPREEKAGHWTAEKKNGLRIRSWPYWRNISKIIVATARGAQSESELKVNAVPHWEVYRDNHLHTLHGWDFKLNLFPLQCSSVSAADWTEYHGQQPELANKESYRQLCRDGGRFAFIRRTVDYHRPKVIFASGVQFRSDFVDAFGFEGSPREIHIEDGNQARTLFAYERNDARGGKMTLVVSPFPGSRHGLNSNKLMEEAGKTLSQYFNADDFDPDRLGRQ
jgi:transcriptional activator of eps genes